MSKQPLFEFEELDRPDVTPLVALHRGHDGWITFHAIDNGSPNGFKNIGSVRASELEGVFPQMMPAIDVDSYFSVNGMFRAGHGTSPAIPELKLPNAHRDKESIRWLTACYADLDCHKLGIDVADAIASVVRAQDEGLIPPASMLTRSGRGVWVWWFLRGENHERLPQRTFRQGDEIRLYCNVQQRINSLLAAIGADAGATDTARITRIPGSINSKSGVRVKYWIQSAERGKPFLYTLKELATAFDVELPTRHPAVESKRAELSIRGRKGQAGRWVKARDQFELLVEKRGRFQHGTRNNAIYIYAIILRSQKLDDDVVWDECLRLYKNHVDQTGEPFTLKDMKAAFKAGKGFNCRGRFGGMRNQKIADMLDVTPEESALFTPINPKNPWPCASRFQSKVTSAEAEKLSRPEKAKRRRGLIQAKVAELDGVVPSLRKIVEWLDEQGLSTVEATVRDDLKALNLHVPRKPKRRARKSSRKLFPE